MLIFLLPLAQMSAKSKAFFSIVPQAVLMLLVLSAFAFSQETSDDAVALFNQGQEFHEKGDLSGAIKLYDKALEVLPEFPEAEYQRAAALQSLGKLDDAEKGFRRAIELRPDWSLALTNLGALLAQENKFTEAEAILARALEIDPQNSSALVSLADLKLHTKASTAALQDILTKVTALTTKANPTAALWSARGAIENALGKRDLWIESLPPVLPLALRLP